MRQTEDVVKKTVATWPVHASLNLKAALGAEGWLLEVQQQPEIPAQQSCKTWLTRKHM